MSFNGEIRTKGAHKSVNRITSARSRSKSFGKCLISILFFGMGAFILSLGKGWKGKGLRAKGFRPCRNQFFASSMRLLPARVKFNNE